MNQLEFEKQISRLVEVYGPDKINPGYIREAYRMFRELSTSDMANVVSLAMERCSYPPRLANLRSIQQEVAKIPNKDRVGSPKECCDTCAPTRIPGHLMRFVKCHGFGYREIYPCPQCNPNPVNAIERQDCYGIGEPIDEEEFEMLNKDF